MFCKDDSFLKTFYQKKKIKVVSNKLNYYIINLPDIINLANLPTQGNSKLCVCVCWDEIKDESYRMDL